MPRYFFNVIDGTAAIDQDGTVLPDVYVAQAEAIRFAGELLRELGGRFWNGAEWRVEVCDEQRRILFVLHFSAEERLPEVGSAVDPQAGPASEGDGTGTQPGPTKH